MDNNFSAQVKEIISFSREEALQNAPAKNEAFFLVPKVIKK